MFTNGVNKYVCHGGGRGIIFPSMCIIYTQFHFLSIVFFIAYYSVYIPIIINQTICFLGLCIIGIRIITLVRLKAKRFHFGTFTSAIAWECVFVKARQGTRKFQRSVMIVIITSISLFPVWSLERGKHTSDVINFRPHLTGRCSRFHRCNWRCLHINISVIIITQPILIGFLPLS